MVRGTRAAMLGLALLIEPTASAQSDATGQLWGNLTLDWHKSPRVTYSLDLEPKALVSGPSDEPGWANIDLTPSAEFAATKWIDLVGEGVFGRTAQTDDLETTELSARAGARFHLFSRQQRALFNEQLPRRRVVIRDLARWEWRRFSYSDGEPSSSSGRFRNRIEFLFPINRPNLGHDGTIHLIADWEWFVPLSDQQERFASRRRYRGGLGYRHNRHWQTAALYLRTSSRNTIDEPFTTSENVLDLQLKRVW
jgi:Protein of unknown function (DUF2490)